jgi:hypothetical protein
MSRLGGSPAERISRRRTSCGLWSVRRGEERGKGGRTADAEVGGAGDASGQDFVLEGPENDEAEFNYE